MLLNCSVQLELASQKRRVFCRRRTKELSRTDKLRKDESDRSHLANRCSDVATALCRRVLVADAPTELATGRVRPMADGAATTVRVL
jgi:hypothetical protein